MSQPAFDVDRFRRSFLLLLVVAISFAFFFLVQEFVSAILLAAIATSLSQPLYSRLLRLLGGRESVAAIATLLLVLVLIIGPLITFMGIVAQQAIEVVGSMRPWVEAQIDPTTSGRLLDRLVMPEALVPYQTQLLAKTGELASMLGQYLLNSLASATRGTASFLLSLFVMLYAMFFFFRDGRAILTQILYYIPLRSEDELRMVMKFVSVSRATLKGSLVIGIVQGGLAGASFAVAGISGSAFWGTVMAVLSIIPGVGTAMVWIPAVIWLWATGNHTSAIGVAIWCAGVVGTVDNVLRPRLVGRDTQMSDLMILLSTLGGLMIFGAIGILVGPILAALFVTVWELYGEAFSDYLPEVDLGETAGTAPTDTLEPEQ